MFAKVMNYSILFYDSIPFSGVVDFINEENQIVESVQLAPSLNNNTKDYEQKVITKASLVKVTQDGKVGYFKVDAISELKNDSQKISEIPDISSYQPFRGRLWSGKYPYKVDVYNLDTGEHFTISRAKEQLSQNDKILDYYYNGKNRALNSKRELVVHDDGFSLSRYAQMISAKDKTIDVFSWTRRLVLIEIRPTPTNDALINKIIKNTWADKKVVEGQPEPTKFYYTIGV